MPQKSLAIHDVFDTILLQKPYGTSGVIHPMVVIRMFLIIGIAICLRIKTVIAQFPDKQHRRIILKMFIDPLRYFTAAVIAQDIFLRGDLSGCQGNLFFILI